MIFTTKAPRREYLEMTNHHLQKLFSQAYLLGGSPCSGKSSLAEKLAARFGLQYYKVDDLDGAHLQRCQPAQQPVMFKYSKMGWDEIWSQPVAQLVADELAYYRERFPFILDDLLHFDLEQPVLLEGAAFLPELVQPFPLKPQNVVFMVPTPEFQVHYYRQRPWIASILEPCRNPAQAFETWMKRDELFGLEVIRQANHLGFPVIRVDGSVDLQGQFDQVSARFGLG